MTQSIDIPQVSIRNLTSFSQKPDETQSLGSVSLPVTAFEGVSNSNPGSWPAFDISGLNLMVANGDKLASVVRTRDTEAYLYNPEIGNQYAGGTGLSRNAAVSQTWNDYELYYGFQTFVINDTVPDLIYENGIE